MQKLAVRVQNSIIIYMNMVKPIMQFSPLGRFGEVRHEMMIIHEGVSVNSKIRKSS